MRIIRFRLRTLMLLVVATGLALAAFDRIGRLDGLDFELLREGALIFVPFLIMLTLWLGLVIGPRMGRTAQRRHAKPPSFDELP